MRDGIIAAKRHHLYPRDQIISPVCTASCISRICRGRSKHAAEALYSTYDATLRHVMVYCCCAPNVPERKRTNLQLLLSLSVAIDSCWAVSVAITVISQREPRYVLWSPGISSEPLASVNNQHQPAGSPQSRQVSPSIQDHDPSGRIIAIHPVIMATCGAAGRQAAGRRAAGSSSKAGGRRQAAGRQPARARLRLPSWQAGRQAARAGGRRRQAARRQAAAAGADPPACRRRRPPQ